MTDLARAVVTQVSPLLIRIETDTDPLPYSPDNYVGSLTVGQRVLVAWMPGSGRSVQAVVTDVLGGGDIMSVTGGLTAVGTIHTTTVLGAPTLPGTWTRRRNQIQAVGDNGWSTVLASAVTSSRTWTATSDGWVNATWSLTVFDEQMYLLVAPGGANGQYIFQATVRPGNTGQETWSSPQAWVQAGDVVTLYKFSTATNTCSLIFSPVAKPRYVYERTA